MAALDATWSARSQKQPPQHPSEASLEQRRVNSMMTYQTPGVYVEEIPSLPPSVAEVSTAIPAFIGCTERAASGVPVARINTLLEYEQLFGGPPVQSFKITTTAAAGSDPNAIPGITSITR